MTAKAACILFYFRYRLNALWTDGLNVLKHKPGTLKDLNILGQVGHFGGCN